ncbi:ankyrin repeat domain-containing protein [Citrifermentans bremense]|nr:ankyrin repeat domain-containing protein [Citrifermentans bremense]
MMTNCANSENSFNLRSPQYYFEDLQTLKLLTAAMSGDATAAKDYVTKGADPNDEGPLDSEYNRLRLLHYAIAAKKPAAVRILLDVGADPEMSVRGFGPAFLFVITHQDVEMMSLLLDHRPVKTLSSETLKDMMLVAATHNRSACLDLLLDRGAPIDYPDDADFTAMMRAMDAENYDMVESLLLRGASVHIETRCGMTPAYSVEFHLKKYKVGSPTYNKVLRLKELMQERGAVFPPPTPAEVRAKRGIKDDPSLYQH